jgi:hypothetical protein
MSKIFGNVEYYSYICNIQTKGRIHLNPNVLTNKSVKVSPN